MVRDEMSLDELSHAVTAQNLFHQTETVTKTCLPDIFYILHAAMGQARLCWMVILARGCCEWFGVAAVKSLMRQACFSFW